MYVRLIGDGSKYQKMVKEAVDSTDKAAKQLQRSSKDAEVFGKTIDNLGTHMSNFAGQMRALAALQSPISFIYDSVRKAAESEKLESAFGTMLQDAAQGKQLVKEIQELAAATPLNQADLQRGAQTLLQFNVGAKQLIPTLRMLGDVTGGDAERLSRMSLAYGQMKASGRLMGQDLLQMINAGFNPLQEISRKTGKSIIELKQDMEKGLITTNMVTDAFKSATSEGGRFFNGMDNASKTLSGLFSTMQDDIDAAKRAVGGYIIEAFHLKEALQEVSRAAQTFVAWFNELSPETKKAVTSVALFVASFMALIVVWKVGAIVLGIVVGVLKDMIVTTRWLAASLNVLNFSFTGLAATIKGLAATALAWAPWVALIGVIVGLVMMAVEHFGGFEEAFKALKAWAVDALGWVEKKFDEFVEWIQPVTDALESLGRTAWVEFKENARATWEVVKDWTRQGVEFVERMWVQMGGSAAPSWEEIRTAAQRALLFVEYTITHVGDVWSYTWASAKITFAEFVTWLADSFFGVLHTVGETFESLLEEITGGLRKFLEDPTEGVSFDLSKVFGATGDGRFAKGKVITDALGLTDWRVKLQKDFADVKSGVIGDFETFYKRKLEEFAQFQPQGRTQKWDVWGQIFKTILNGSDEAADGVKRLTREVHRFDAALFGSAESKARIAAFKDMVGATRRPAQPDTRQTVNYPAWDVANQLGGALPDVVNDTRGRGYKSQPSWDAMKQGSQGGEAGGAAAGDILLRVLQKLDMKLTADSERGTVEVTAADLD